MPDSPPTDDAAFARYPRTRADLTDTSKCPACFSTLESLVCGVCGLDVSHPSSAELATLSMDAASLLDQRIELIALMRSESARWAATAAALAAEPVPDPEPVPDAVSLAPSPTSAVTVPLPPPVVAPTPTARPVAPPAPRRSSVQVALVIVGVSLLSIFAISFIVYAFVTYGIVWQSVIIGAVTATAFAVASVLRSRGLTSTGEGIGAFAVVLVYLDAYAVRAYNLFGAAATDATLYWGLTLVASALVFVVWHRVFRLRVASIAAFVTLAPGVGLVVAGLAQPLETVTGSFLGYVAIALAGLVHPYVRFAAPNADPATREMLVPERTIALVIAGGGAALAYVSAIAAGRDSAPEILATLTAVAVVSALHAGVARGTGATSAVVRGFGLGFAALAGLSASTAAVAFPYLSLEFHSTVAVAPIAAALVAVAVAVATTRVPSTWRATVRSAAIAPVVVAGLTLVPVTAIALYSTSTVVFGGQSWRLAADASVATAMGPVLRTAAVVALLGAVVAALGCAAATRTLRRHSTLAVSLGAAVLVLAAPALDRLWAVVAVWTLIAVAAVVALLRTRTADARGIRLALTTVALVGGTLAYAASWSSEGTWLAVSVVTIALLLVSRTVVALGGTDPSDPAAHLVGAVSRASLLGGATVVGFVTVSASALLLRSTEGLASDWVFQPDALRLSSVLAVVLLAGTALPAASRLSVLDRHTLFGIAAVVAATSIVNARFASGEFSLLAEPATETALGVALLGALLAWIAPRPDPSFLVERAIAVAAVPVALFWLLDTVASAAGLAGVTRDLVPVAAALICAAVALWVTVAAPGHVPRRASDIGIVLVAAPGLLGAWTGTLPAVADDVFWLALLLTAVTVLLLAVGRDGLVGAESARRHLGWVSLTLATAGLWWRLAASSVSAVEAYVLPLAGVLLVIAVLAWRVERASESAPALLLAALLVAVVPVALVGIDGPLVRALVVGVAGAALLLGGTWLRTEPAARPYLDAASAAGLVGVLIVAVGRSSRSWFDETTGVGLELEAWLGAAVAVLVVAAIGQARIDRPTGGRISAALLGTALGLVLVFEGTAVNSSDSPLASVRAVVVVVLLSAAYLAGTILDRAPLSVGVGRLAVVFAAAMAVVSASVVDPVEWVVLPIAAALLITGSRRLRLQPALRSWPALGLGIGVLLLPSLLVTTVDRPVWRLVAIGVVATAVFVVGFLRKLQAPFLVGAVVALVHGVATFSPELAAISDATEWWVWAGAVGVPVIILAARYERSLATARSVVLGIGALR
ncbi:hypothetical protein HD599_001898 [Conyzicola lurida]|uniref:Uncharacterized protein n=1 Tax=Conyzicola lurida TaxID=1172621 RepID=A0A841APT3_9MICO|nr:hypothetical protein [Conyzicola lurida]MBB5843575.1 hypothetical protein [Conyzicola lurida]